MAESKVSQDEPKTLHSGENEPQKLDPKEQSKLQAMFGNGKQQAAKYCLNQKGKKETLNDTSVLPQATVFFKNCHDCEYTLDAMCTKVLIESCHNTTIVFKQKIITSIIEIYKTDNFNLDIQTKVETLQADVCNGLNVKYKSKEMYQSMVWAGVKGLSLHFVEENYTLNTGFDEMEKLHGELKLTIDQFITRWVKDSLITERVIRLDNGFPTTEREKKVYDDRQEEALQKLAKDAGINIGKKSEKKIPPNSICPKCKSGLKYKKCCGKTL